eukprot:UN12651
MSQSVSTSILHPAVLTPAETINLADSTSPAEPALKKRKLNENGSIPIATSTFDSTDTSNNSSDTSSENTHSKKRKIMDIDSKDDDDNIDHNKNKNKKQKDVFSMYCIKKMLKADQTLNDFQISAEAAAIIGKATHCFMDELLKESISNATNNTLEYDNIASYIDSKDKLSFLTDIVPTRISYGKISDNNVSTENNDNSNNCTE